MKRSRGPGHIPDSPPQRKMHRGYGLSSENMFAASRAEKCLTARCICADSLDAPVRTKLRALHDQGLVREGDLDERAYAALAQFMPSVAVEVLQRFVSSPLQEVRNKSAYLNGVMGSFRKFESNVPFTEEVHSQLCHLVKQGVLRFGQLDGRCLDALARAPPHVALSTLEKLETKRLSDIHNMSAFVVSVLRQVESEHQKGGLPAQAVPSLHSINLPAPPKVTIESVPITAQMLAGINASHTPIFLSGVGCNSMYSQAMPGMFDQLSVLGNVPNTLMMQPGTTAIGFPAQLPAGAVVHAVLPAAAQQPTHQSLVGQSAALSVKNYGMEQRALGVRTDEFHALSALATFVHPAPALKLQTLWDEGNRLVSLLDERAWETMTQLGAPEALAVIEEVVKQPPHELRNVNAFLQAVSRKYLDAKPKPHGVEPPRTASTQPQALQLFGPMVPLAPSMQHTQSQQLMGFNAAPTASQQHPAAPYQDAGFASGGLQRVKLENQGSRSMQAAGDLETLPRLVRHALEGLLASKGAQLRREHLDEGVVDVLSRLSETDALAVVDEMRRNDMAAVRNVPAYIMGMCKRYRRH